MKNKYEYKKTAYDGYGFFTEKNQKKTKDSKGTADTYSWGVI